LKLIQFQTNQSMCMLVKEITWYRWSYDSLF